MTQIPNLSEYNAAGDDGGIGQFHELDSLEF